jgi:electron transfer flavoprotein alpha subunit
MADCLVAIIPGAARASRSELAAIGFAKLVAEKAGGAFDILILGPQAQRATGSVTNRGARAVLVAEHADLAQPTGEALAAAIAAVASSRPYRVVAGASATITRDSFPRLAARLGAPMATDVLSVDELSPEAMRITKPCFSGNLLGQIELQGPTVVAICRPSSFEAAQAVTAASNVEAVKLPERLAHPRKQFIEMNRTPLSRPELTEADIVVSGGRGTKGDFRPIEQLADLLGAAIGASRAVVDAGWMPNDFQVGQTGKVVAPKLYFACGLSGAIQHLAGMRNSKTIVAINKDPNAPIFEVADYGLVADLFEAIPQFVETVKKARG